ncbi:sodium:solute symporter [Arenibacter sp. ARW7G5Y1]|uniref:sodium:solute symporter n=1 Tax=Arenibacter sp. ARW7G5Y1 TaxID=2135619 RepID=UPI000D764269|nr:sodium:solute symporter [Arenibacter sp. ARW7G5Y1]PXX23782.1 SSS family solute:Na+ symporter [Arenibacter sp. ARW7G5Y1]
MDKVFGSEPGINIGSIDIVVIAVYLVLIVGIGIWVSVNGQRKYVDKSYFLAGGKLTWPLIGLALFSTNISTIHIIGFAQEGYENGLAYGNFEWMAAFSLIALSLFFAPLYFRSKIATLPDFLEKRYGKGPRNWLAVVSIVSAIVIHIGFTLYTGAVVLEGLFGIPIMTSIIVTAILTGIYTIVGGLMAVVVTESLQTVVLLIGSVILTTIAYDKIGGWKGLSANVDPMMLTVMRPSGDASNLPWYSVLLGYPVIGLWYWCADQTIVQRVLGAKNEMHARIGPLFAGFIKIIPVFIFILPGVICLGLVNQGKLPQLTDTKNTYDFMIRELLPTGLVGVMAAALLAALMSTVSGALNSIATLFSFDIYKRWKPDTSDSKLVNIGRLATMVAMVLAILWSPLVGKFPTLYQGINTIISYLAPPITTVFVFGVFWRKASTQGAMMTLVLGSIMGLMVFLLDWFKQITDWDVPFLLSAFYLFIFCSFIMIMVSLVKPHVHTVDSENLIWASPLESLKGDAWRGIGDFKVLALVLFIVIVLLYILFS